MNGHPHGPAQESLDRAKETMQRSRAMHHTFLRRFQNEVLSTDQLRSFAVQWHKTARLHKEAFPALVWNTRDDDVRFDLVEILREEYGNGNRQKIHARLLWQFVERLGLTDGNLEVVATLPAVTDFGQQVLAVWKDADPVVAFGLHFSLEYMASALHVYFADGLAKYAFLTPHDREYFEYHRIAEQEHADFSERGYLQYATDIEASRDLEAGVRLGIELLEALWDAFDAHVFGGPALTVLPS